jgi:acetyl-CoA acetyltransferase
VSGGPEAVSGGPEAAIAGIGETEFSKESGRSDLRLALEAAKLALGDAGLRPGDVDGIVVPAVVTATAEDLMTHLGIEDLAYSASVVMGGAGPAAAVHHARLAIRAGIARNVLIAFGHNGRSGARLGRRPPRIMGGEAPTLRRNFDGVHGLITPAQFYALWAQRYLYEHDLGGTEAFGMVASVQSRHAVLNGKSASAREITVADHQASRMISDPFRLYDCSRETDGGAALVVSAAESGAEGAVLVRGTGEGHPAQPDQPTTRVRFMRSGMGDAGRRAFAMAGWTPADVDVAELYDAFTFNVLWQLEDLGFCGPGEAPELVASGGIELGGRLPVNTHGGLLSQAHLWGINHVTEAVKQLRGTAGKAQVPGARRALVTGSGDLGDAAVLLLERG